MNSAAAKAAVRRMALTYVPLSLLSAGGLMLFLAQAEGIILIVIAAILTLLFGYQAVQAVRDLGEEPVTTTGRVLRKWSRGDFIFWRSYYAYIEKTVFKLEPEVYHDLEEGDEVLVLYYPHTVTVASIEKQPQPPQGQSSSSEGR